MAFKLSVQVSGRPRVSKVVWIRRAHLTTSVSLDYKVSQTSEDQIVNGSGRGQDARQELGDPQSVDENVTHVVRGDVNAGNLALTISFRLCSMPIDHLLGS